MTRVALTTAIVLCFVFLIRIQTEAQTSEAKRFPPANKRQAASRDPLFEQHRHQKRAFAIQMVSALANEARSFKDESLRARVQARAADVLWAADQDRAKILFNRAWEAAEVVDKAGLERVEEDKRRFLSGQGGSGFIPPPPNLRGDVLRLAAGRDRLLAETFLAKMQEDEKRAEEEKKFNKWSDPTEPSQSVAKRLELARQLLEVGDTVRALEIGMPVLNRATAPGIIFLVILRQKNISLADQLFASLMESSIADPTADATTVALLSSYVFTPSVLVTVTRNGLLMNPWTESLPPPDLSTALRLKFFRGAAEILTRPLTMPELESTSAGRAGTYFTIMRLMPLFEQYYPEGVSALKGRVSALAQTIEDVVPETHRRFVSAGFGRKEDDDLSDLPARIERAANTNERDHLFAVAARSSANRGDLKARDLAGRIDNPDLQKRVRNFVDVILVAKTIESREPEKAMQLARTGELTNLQRVWSYTEIVRQLKPLSFEPPQEVVSHAITEAGRIPMTSTERADAFVAIARCTGVVDKSRMWEAALDAVKNINRVSDYTGEDNKLVVRFQSKQTVVMENLPAPAMSLTGLLDSLASEDAYLAAEIAKSISGESPRSVALLAIARTIFSEKPPGKRL